MDIRIGSRRVLRGVVAVLVGGVTLAVLNAAPNGEPTKLLRTPAISATHIAFA
jgi:hypothetical protein